MLLRFIHDFFSIINSQTGRCMWCTFFFHCASDFCCAHAPNSNTIYEEKQTQSRAVNKAERSLWNCCLKTHLSGAWSSQSRITWNWRKNMRARWKNACKKWPECSQRLARWKFQEWTSDFESDLTQLIWLTFCFINCIFFLSLARPLNPYDPSTCKMFRNVFQLFFRMLKLLNLIFYCLSFSVFVALACWQCFVNDFVKLSHWYPLDGGHHFFCSCFGFFEDFHYSYGEWHHGVWLRLELE